MSIDAALVAGILVGSDEGRGIIKQEADSLVAGKMEILNNRLQTMERREEQLLHLQEEFDEKLQAVAEAQQELALFADGSSMGDGEERFGDWVKKYDAETGDAYWLNEATGETSWDAPPGYDEATLADYDTDGGGAPGEEWEKAWDETSEAVYWYNHQTEETVWRDPFLPKIPFLETVDNPDDWVSFVDDETLEEYYYNTVDGSTSWGEGDVDSLG